MPSIEKSDKDIINMKDVKKDAKTILEKILGDISKTSATKQMIMGVGSGWLTGFLAIRIGKTTALALGGGIILLQIASEKGYVKINWDKVNKNMNKVADKVEETVTGQRSTAMDKVERYVDNKVTTIENTLKNKQRKAKSWYLKFVGENDVQLKEIHIFLISFTAGLALGCGSS